MKHKELTQIEFSQHLEKCKFDAEYKKLILTVFDITAGEFYLTPDIKSGIFFKIKKGVNHV